ncbi:MAG: HD domain-containing phosphohydrolase [Candidatus Caenarcaniphilales bacterium]|nr:HD domain-containing phosphohydrolase [Candidatus Caenarcaniphilales bacterium]
MSEVLLDFKAVNGFPTGWVHLGSQRIYDEIISSIQPRAAFLPQILLCLEQVQSLIQLTSSHSNSVGLHLGRVGLLAALIAKHANLHWKERLECLFGSWIHDVGKSMVPLSILEKPGRLTAEEYRIMQDHVAFGCSILADYPHLQPFLDPLRYHHERWDGNGYPYKLRGMDIPITGRITCLADSYDAMTSFRPYPPYQRTHEEAITEIKRCAGSHFDPSLVKIFLKIPQQEIEDLIHQPANLAI